MICSFSFVRKMNRMQCKSRRTVFLVLGLVFVYFLIRIRNYEHKIFVLIPKVHPNEPWEFVADFSNMKILNPTILDFTIIAESGNYDHWKYSTEYTEKLSHWPHLANYATAHFQVKASAKKDIYYINSVHRTCLIMGFYCLDSESEFKFSKSNHTNGSICEESIIYQCPVFLASFCRREVLFQRTAIMNNLKKKFLINT